MSRSKRKTPVCGWTSAESEKEDKRTANRVFRRINKVRLRVDKEPLVVRETSNVFMWSKDGKQLFDPKKFPKGMRK